MHTRDGNGCSAATGGAVPIGVIGVPVLGFLTRVALSETTAAPAGNVVS
jgi:hypothetical protein